MEVRREVRAVVTAILFVFCSFLVVDLVVLVVV